MTFPRNIYAMDMSGQRIHPNFLQNLKTNARTQNVKKNLHWTYFPELDTKIKVFVFDLWPFLLHAMSIEKYQSEVAF